MYQSIKPYNDAWLTGIWCYCWSCRTLWGVKYDSVVQPALSCPPLTIVNSVWTLESCWQMNEADLAKLSLQCYFCQCGRWIRTRNLSRTFRWKPLIPLLHIEKMIRFLSQIMSFPDIQITTIYSSYLPCVTLHTSSQTTLWPRSYYTYFIVEKAEDWTSQIIYPRVHAHLAGGRTEIWTQVCSLQSPPYFYKMFFRQVRFKWYHLLCKHLLCCILSYPHPVWFILSS